MLRNTSDGNELAVPLPMTTEGDSVSYVYSKPGIVHEE